MRLQILNWDEHFENYKSRTYDNCGFVCVPNKCGIGVTRILAQPNGIALYGVWCMMLGFLSRQHRPRLGIMTDNGAVDGRPLTPDDLSIMWRTTPEIVSQALSIFCDHKVGWAKDLDSQYPDGILPVSAQYPDGIHEQNRTEQNKNTPSTGVGERAGLSLTVAKNGHASKFAPADVERIYALYPRHVGRRAALLAIAKGLAVVANRATAPLDPLAWILARVEMFKKSPAGNQGRFTPHPATWFNQGRYDDDPAEWQKIDGKPKPKPIAIVTNYNGTREKLARWDREVEAEKKAGLNGAEKLSDLLPARFSP